MSDEHKCKCGEAAEWRCDDCLTAWLCEGCAISRDDSGVSVVVCAACQAIAEWRDIEFDYLDDGDDIGDDDGE
jgi:hypothetical protein